MAHSTRSGSSFARCVYVTKHTSAHFEILQESSKSSKGKAASPPPILQAYQKRLQGVMLVVNNSRVVRRCYPLFFCAAIQIANFIQMKGTDAFRFCFRGLFVVRSPWVLLLQPAANCSLFAFVRCYCLRVGALVCACTLFEAALFAVCAAFIAFAILCPPCTLSRVYVACIAASFVLPPFGESTRGGAKMEEQHGNKPPASVGAFYSLRSPSASRCNFSAIR